MIPLSDSVQIRRPAWITASLVTACVVVFLYELTLPEARLDRFIQDWGASPHIVLLALGGDPRVPRTELITLFTSQFLHGGWIHLLGNMVFLWVFGRAVEDRFGHVVFLLMYLLGGALASIIQSFVSGPREATVLIGASGAIATVLGAYLISYPRAWVRVLVPIFFFFWFFDVPAVLMLALWFLGQFFTGIFAISSVAAPGDVAVWAHVGGFVVGVGMAIVLPAGKAGGLERRVDGPGPAGLVNSVASLAVLVLALRALMVFLEVRPGAGAIGQLATFAFTVTTPFVWPIEIFLPWVRFAGRPLDLPALVAIALVLLLAQLIIHRLAPGPKGRLGKR